MHDIEDLARLGRSLHACPYFGSRALAETAELVFAPYSYLIDPLIRRAAAISLKGAVLIFDEGARARRGCCAALLRCAAPDAALRTRWLRHNPPLK